MFYLDKLDMLYICGSVPALVTAKPCAYMYVVNINVSITDAEFNNRSKLSGNFSHMSIDTSNKCTVATLSLYS